MQSRSVAGGANLCVLATDGLCFNWMLSVGALRALDAFLALMLGKCFLSNCDVHDRELVRPAACMTCIS